MEVLKYLLLNATEDVIKSWNFNLFVLSERYFFTNSKNLPQIIMVLIHPLIQLHLDCILSIITILFYWIFVLEVTN